ncbi:PAAR domain-containing protein [Phyllobacterium leguminum]|uniref:Putative Zn-binding protein involved in type VI secretion n=1 Tax=Phyllobacterium leguminum TaxID=314237 RepID=A0A318ST70_9HYPH|nr:PAAR domain-containing protein [Phyllobacterium leguminum]PYE85161.1 putative Zn-binding protein involved in type VI secretion [Phyllobacterium leguminum]
MPASVRKGDIGSGHGCHYPPTPAMTGSPNVLINGIPAVRVGDAYAAHGCPSCPAPAHGRAQAAGSPTVFINGRPAARIGDAIDCGGAALTGSGNVFFDGE